MSKIPASKVKLSVASVALEDDLNSFTLTIDQETPPVTSFADAGPRRVVGNYDYNLDLGMVADFASGQSDATLFGLIGASSAKAVAVDPTGASAGASDPNFDSVDMLLSSYSISGSVGGAVEASAHLVGNALLARQTS